VLARLSTGLPDDLAGQRRLLERGASHDDAEMLRAVIVELGAAAVLGWQPRPAA
jgi:hypothetical protein